MFPLIWMTKTNLPGAFGPHHVGVQKSLPRKGANSWTVPTLRVRAQRIYLMGPYPMPSMPRMYGAALSLLPDTSYVFVEPSLNLISSLESLKV